jgi:hypothetical protein
LVICTRMAITLRNTVGTRESKAPGGRPAAAADDRVAFDGLSMRAGHSVVRAMAHGMRATWCVAGRGWRRRSLNVCIGESIPRRLRPRAVAAPPLETGHSQRQILGVNGRRWPYCDLRRSNRSRSDATVEDRPFPGGRPCHQCHLEAAVHSAVRCQAVASNDRLMSLPPHRDRA